MTPFVTQEGRYRTLHLADGDEQSRMDLDDPDALQVDYTRTMMGFLLLQPAPRRMALVGMGGGSLVKFCHRHLPATHLTVVEIDPAVVALRREFLVPDDDVRLATVVADGAAFIAQRRAEFDALLLDGFDGHDVASRLATAEFYRDCRGALAPGGALAVNLHGEWPALAPVAARIATAFDGNAARAPSAEHSNWIVFARSGGPDVLAYLRAGGAPGGEAAHALREELQRIRSVAIR